MIIKQTDDSWQGYRQAKEWEKRVSDPDFDAEEFVGGDKTELEKAQPVPEKASCHRRRQLHISATIHLNKRLIIKYIQLSAIQAMQK